MELLFLIIIPILAACVSFTVRQHAKALEATALSASVAEVLLAVFIAYKTVVYGSYSFGSVLFIDALALLFIFMIVTGALAVSSYSIGYLREEVRKKIIGFHRVRQYFILLHLFIAAMLLAILSASPVIMWIAIEATTLATAFLISFYNEPSAQEAAWKYLILNSIGLLLAFFGTLLFFTPVIGSPGHIGAINWDAIFRLAPMLNPLVAKMAFVFVLVGYGTKVGFVPMHTWRPDAYSKAPSPIVALFSGSLLGVAFFAILRFKLLTDIAVGPLFSQHLLIALGLASLILAPLLMYNQKNYRRLLAYSSIEHAGIIALGFGFGGIGVLAALLHMLYHSLAKSALFLSSGNILLKYSSSRISNVSGMRSLLPVTSIIFFIGLLAVAGVPPFGLFFTEVLILSEGIRAYPAITVVALLALALSFVALLRHASTMMFGPGDENIDAGEANAWMVVPLIGLIVLLVCFSIFLPGWFRSLLAAAALPYGTHIHGPIGGL